MNRFLPVILAFALILSACTSTPQESAGPVLKVSSGDNEKTYTVDDLQALGAVQATFRDIAYVGVPLTMLLQDAGIEPASVTVVKAVAVDGFTANYEAALFTREDTLVAYARTDGPLGEEEGAFRMVLPDQEGKMNPRELVEIIAIP